VRFDWPLTNGEFRARAVSGYRVRPAVRDDLDGMLAVISAAYASDPVWRELTADIERRVGGRIRDHLEDPRAHFTVAEREGAIVALNGVALDHPTRQSLITGICVAPAHQGRGLGTALLAVSLAWLRDRGVATATVTTDGQSVAARVYARFGAIRTSGVAHEDAPKPR
jgi:N-acetylglutamate synthase-like GNAT family acetyltransferase